MLPLNGCLLFPQFILFCFILEGVCVEVEVALWCKAKLKASKSILMTSILKTFSVAWLVGLGA